ncbi:MAG: hypothetical protein HZA89_14050 [Verrucomicrobia bacterium]|nr:hypothetical protein [Verrucomicrobiota bacterium]
MTDEVQEHAKSAQTDATADIEAAARAAYTLASNALTTGSGFLGKTGSEADEARRLRAGVSKQGNPAQVAAFVTSVIAYLNNHKPALLAKHYDPTAKIAELTPLTTSLTTGKGDQESKKGARGDATTAIDDATDALFNSANDQLEAAIGLYDPDSEFVKEARRIRLALRGPEGGGTTPPPAPPAPPNP